MVVSERRERLDFLPRRQPPAYFSGWQLDQQCRRRLGAVANAFD